MVISYIYWICWCMKSAFYEHQHIPQAWTFARPRAMQEMRGNTSVDTYLDLPNKLMWSYLSVPTYLMELWWIFSSCLGWLKDRTFHLCLSYLTSFWNQLLRIWYQWYYGSSTWGTRALFLVCGSSPQLNKCPSSSYPLKAKYVELMGKGKGYNSSHVYCQAKGWSKKR
jgi:hypothetical protein